MYNTKLALKFLYLKNSNNIKKFNKISANTQIINYI
jgi:hypothetical protein